MVVVVVVVMRTRHLVVGSVDPMVIHAAVDAVGATAMATARIATARTDIIQCRPVRMCTTTMATTSDTVTRIIHTTATGCASTVRRVAQHGASGKRCKANGSTHTPAWSKPGVSSVHGWPRCFQTTRIICVICTHTSLRAQAQSRAREHEPSASAVYSSLRALLALHSSSARSSGGIADAVADDLEVAHLEAVNHLAALQPASEAVAAIALAQVGRPSQDAEAQLQEQQSSVPMFKLCGALKALQPEPNLARPGLPSSTITGGIDARGHFQVGKQPPILRIVSPSETMRRSSCRAVKMNSVARSIMTAALYGVALRAAPESVEVVVGFGKGA